jgi:murein endopeptidase
MRNAGNGVDGRGYFMLPQRPGERAYYAYGTPAAGAAQYGHPRMISFLYHLEFLWGSQELRSIGIGNISLAEGASFPPHRGHRSGLEVDIRPMRKDGAPKPVRWQDAQYDQAGTSQLVNLIYQTGMVSRVLFNDLAIPRVQRAMGHDDHLHVEVNR